MSTTLLNEVLSITAQEWSNAHVSTAPPLILNEVLSITAQEFWNLSAIVYDLASSMKS